MNLGYDYDYCVIAYLLHALELSPASSEAHPCNKNVTCVSHDCGGPFLTVKPKGWKEGRGRKEGGEGKEGGEPDTFCREVLVHQYYGKVCIHLKVIGGSRWVGLSYYVGMLLHDKLDLILLP